MLFNDSNRTHHASDFMRNPVGLFYLRGVLCINIQSGDQYGIVNEGSGHYSGLTVLIKGTDPLDMTVLVRNVEKKAGKKTVEENEVEESAEKESAAEESAEKESAEKESAEGKEAEKATAGGTQAEGQKVEAQAGESEAE